MNSPITTADPSVLYESAEELYEHAPCGYMSALPDGTIIRVNQTLLDWTGYSREALLGRRLREFLPPAGKVFYETHFDPLLRMQGFVREMALDLIRHNGSKLPVIVSSVQHRDDTGRPVVIRTTLFDATERRTYERELINARRRAEQLAAVVECSADAIIVITPEGKVQSWNGGAERLFGYSLGEALGRPIRDLIVPPDRAGEFEEALHLLCTGVQMQLETVRVHKNGTRIDVSLGLTPQIEPPGELVAISAIIRDVTEQRRLEARLRQAEQLQSVATLAGGVAHEVNNQMAVVLGFGELVLRALGNDHPQRVDVQSMVTAASKAAGISNQLLAFSRQLPIARETVHLSRLLDDLVPELNRLLGPDVSLAVKSNVGDTQIRADPGQIQQILLQLATNSADAMTSGGQLTISTDLVQLTDRDVEARPGENIVPGVYTMIEVADNGAGMDSATLGRAFEPFFTTKPVGKGTGLGLAVVHGIVKQHGGHVWAASNPGQGTAVRVYLPRSEDSGERPER